MFYFCLNIYSPTVASPYHVFLEETHVLRIIFAQRSLLGSLLSVLVLVILCEPVNVETESRNFLALEAQRVYR